MLIFINLIVILLYGLLALLSRKHYSKYKKRYKKGRSIKVIFDAMGYTIFHKFQEVFPLERIKHRIRKVQVVSKDTLDELAEDYIVKNAATCLLVLFVSVLGSLLVSVAWYKKADETSNIVEREGYTGDTRKQEIYLTVDGETSVYELEVMPLEYTEQEFLQEARDVRDWLETAILNGNSDLSSVTTDLLLPEWDSNNRFHISWQSQHPEIITSYGKVEWDLLKEDVEVMLLAEISYLDYSTVFEYPITLRGRFDDDKSFEVFQLIQEIEAQNRTQEAFVLPGETKGVSITTKQGKKNSAMLWLGVGVVVCFVVLICERVRLEEQINERNKQLTMQYSNFVSRISMLLGTGLTLRGCMEQLALELDNQSTLKSELTYMVQEIKTGKSETDAYDAFATRIGMPMYARLMNQLVQNLRVGTHNLIRILEEEIDVSLEIRREFMKKRGEEVSTKLLFPMMVLLLVVMIIVILPALQNM